MFTYLKKKKRFCPNNVLGNYPFIKSKYNFVALKRYDWRVVFFWSGLWFHLLTFQDAVRRVFFFFSTHLRTSITVLEPHSVTISALSFCHTNIKHGIDAELRLWRLDGFRSLTSKCIYNVFSWKLSGASFHVVVMLAYLKWLRVDYTLCGGPTRSASEMTVFHFTWRPRSVEPSRSLSFGVNGPKSLEIFGSS